MECLLMYYLNTQFIKNVNVDEQLKASRDYVETKIWGFGERSFWWLWKLICEELPENPKLLEIGCFRGATLSLWKLLRADSTVYGITPLNTSGGMWESDYAADIKKIHDDFGLKQPQIWIGRSDDLGIISKAQTLVYDVIYIDGGHERVDIDNDLHYYAPGVKQGGYLVVDDAACWMSMPFGYFQGILPVSEGLGDYMQEHGDEWEFIINVVHLMVYKRK